MNKYKVKIVKFLDPDVFEWVEVEALNAIQAQVIAAGSRPDYIGVEAHII
jgi:hypothetical protein